LPSRTSADERFAHAFIALRYSPLTLVDELKIKVHKMTKSDNRILLHR